MQPIHNFYNYEHRHDDRRRDNISNSDNPDRAAYERWHDAERTYYNDDPDSYEYVRDLNHEFANLNVFRTALWAIYCIAGGDPDGNNQFHCSDRDAIRATIETVKALRWDYDDILSHERESS